MIKVAMIGVGGMGKTHIDNISAMEGAAVTDICDRNPQAGELADRLSARFYTSHQEMLAHTRADVVVVCTPTFLHEAQIRDVLLRKKHCITEKPICLSSVQCRALYRLARENGVQLYVGQVLHFFEEYETAERIVRGGSYGRVVDASFWRLTEKPRWTDGGWLFDREKSGLLPYDLHIHELDFIIGLLGRPQGAQLQKGMAQAGQGYNDYYRILYRYERATVCAEAAWYGAPIPFTHGFRLYLERAALLCDGGGCLLYRRDEAPERLSGAQKEHCRSTRINVVPTNAYYREMAHFLDCASKNQPSGRVPEENVVAVLETLEQLKAQLD